MSEPQCKDCQYFIQHYIISEGKICRIFSGHCIHSKSSHKRSHNPACKHFLPGTPPEDDFATKTYLSKKLLEYILTLDLLPEIQDMAELPEKKK